MSVVNKSEAYQKKRVIKRGLGEKSLEKLLGPIEPGCWLFWIGKGQHSLVDVITYCLRYTGPAFLTVSTWTASGADIDFARSLLTSGDITGARWVLDFSFPNRQAAFCAALRERFGDDSIRLTKLHTKFCLLSNEQWRLCIITSANLNLNSRFEQYQVIEDSGLHSYLAGIVDALFAEHEAGAQFQQTAWERCEDFERFGESAGVDVGQKMSEAGDKERFFSDEHFGVDLRRAGFSYSKSGEVVK